MFLCVVGRVGKRTEGYADVEVGENKLDTGIMERQNMLGGVAMIIIRIWMLVEEK